jgi:predicted transcriptional regulator of viral defense system
VNSEKSPRWDELYELASAQEGHFSTRQAAHVGYSPQLLAKYLRNGRVARVRRGVYRLVHFPAGDHEDLVTVWLWSEREGVFSHETALALHQLSDVLPARVHLSLPDGWRHRRLRVPMGVVIHHADVGDEDRAWIGPVPVTSPRRTLADCAASNVSPETLEKAARDALRRGIVSRTDIAGIERALGRTNGAR